MKVIFGSAGFAKEVYLILVKLYSIDVEVECFVCADQDPSSGQAINNIPILSESVFFEKYRNHAIEAYIAVGSPNIKKKIVDKIAKNLTAVSYPRLIDPSANLDRENNFLNIGQGAIICGGTSLTIDITIGDFTHLNLNSTVGHDVFIGSYSTISPGANISGKVRIGDMSFLGTSAVILENIEVMHGIVVGAGAVVARNILEPGTYVGIPAKKLNYSK